MRRSRLFSIVLLCSLAAVASAASTGTTKGPAPVDVIPHPGMSVDPKIPFEKYTLDNGLEVILLQDNSVPIVAVNLWYHVGSGDEVLGKSGFAHLFEHMMFQGSVHTGEDAHFKVLRKIGGTGVNGSTNTDRTNYFEVVPSNQIETGLWLESDRMGYLLPLLTEESLGNQRDVVRNERRQRVDNVPYGKEDLRIWELLFADGHPYRHQVIGLHEDLAAASVDDVKNFFKKWYVPSNATLVVAGDFDKAEAKKLVQKWFGNFPKAPKPAHKMVMPTPVNTTKRDVVSDDFAKLRMVDYAWHSPASFAKGDAELDIIASALGADGTGRLWKILVHDKQLAQSVRVSQQGMGMSGIFDISVELKPDADMAAVEKIIDEEVEKIMKEPITDREFQRVITRREARFVFGLEPLMSRVETLQRYNHYLGNPDSITTDLDRFRKSSPAACQQVAAATLEKNHRVEVITMPNAKSDSAEKPEGHRHGGGK